MTPHQQTRIDNWQVHPSQRGVFAFELYKAMAANDNIWCLTGDLGWSMLDNIRDDFPERFINCGAAEQSMLGAAIGIALTKDQIVFCYSITSFLLFRGFEWVRNFINHENIPVRLVGSGLDDDYAHDGITHQTFDAKAVLNLFPNIATHFPDNKEQVPSIVTYMTGVIKPHFLCLRR